MCAAAYLCGVTQRIGRIDAFALGQHEVDLKAEARHPPEGVAVERVLRLRVCSEVRCERAGEVGRVRRIHAALRIQIFFFLKRFSKHCRYRSESSLYIVVWWKQRDDDADFLLSVGPYE